jgi:hypothetical protein
MNTKKGQFEPAMVRKLNEKQFILCKYATMYRVSHNTGDFKNASRWPLNDNIESWGCQVLMRGLFCNKLFKKPNYPKFEWFHLCSDFGQFLTGPSSDHRPTTKMAGRAHQWRTLFILYTPDILSFGLNALKMKKFDIEFHFFVPLSRILNWHFVLTDFLQWIPCSKGTPCIKSIKQKCLELNPA